MGAPKFVARARRWKQLQAGAETQPKRALSADLGAIGHLLIRQPYIPALAGIAGNILLAISRARNFDSARFLTDFMKSECYWEPMHLEDAGSGTFLETVFSINPDRTVRCRLKNVNENDTMVWRYHHYRSQLDYTTTRAILMSTLRKVDAMASDPQQLAIKRSR